jgi:hypothetical protein
LLLSEIRAQDAIKARGIPEGGNARESGRRRNTSARPISPGVDGMMRTPTSSNAHPRALTFVRRVRRYTAVVINTNGQSASATRDVEIAVDGVSGRSVTAGGGNLFLHNFQRFSNSSITIDAQPVVLISFGCGNGEAQGERKCFHAILRQAW